ALPRAAQSGNSHATRPNFFVYAELPLFRHAIRRHTANIRVSAVLMVPDGEARKTVSFRRTELSPSPSTPPTPPGLAVLRSLAEMVHVSRATAHFAASRTRGDGSLRSRRAAGRQAAGLPLLPRA